MTLGSPNKAIPTPMKGGVKRKETRFWEKKNEAKNPILSTCKCNRTKI